MVRTVVGALVMLVMACGTAGAQHKIPPIPETARAPVVLPSGLKYIDIKVGTGVPAVKGRMVRIAFIGWVSKTQLMFDFRDPPNPLAFHLGKPDPNVVPGIERRCCRDARGRQAAPDRPGKARDTAPAAPS